MSDQHHFEDYDEPQATRSVGYMHADVMDDIAQGGPQKDWGGEDLRSSDPWSKQPDAYARPGLTKETQLATNFVMIFFQYVCRYHCN